MLNLSDTFLYRRVHPVTKTVSNGRASIESIADLIQGSIDATSSLPSGGLLGQALVKQSDLDFDYTWTTISGGGGGGDPTNLSYTPSTRLLTSSTGTDVTLPLLSSSDAGLAPASGGGTSNFLRADGTWAVPAGGGGGVTSVGGTGTVSGLTLTGTVTSTGNLTLGGTLAVLPSNFASQTAATFLAAPNGTAGVPTFRTIVAADIPTLNQNTTGSAATLTTTRSITMSGDVSWTVNFNGSANVTAAGTIANSAVTNAKMADMATATFKGRVTGTTGAPEDMTATQATSLLNTFTTSLKGLAPASGGGTTNFLRADGTWAAPAGGSGTNISYTASTRAVASSTGTGFTFPLLTSTDAGLAPASGGGTSNFLRADGTWATPAGGGGTTNNFAATAAPTVSNDGTQGYAVGSQWLWASRNLSWTCLSSATGAAVWTQNATPAGLSRANTYIVLPNYSQAGVTAIGGTFQIMATEQGQTVSPTNVYTRTARNRSSSTPSGSGQTCGFRARNGGGATRRDMGFNIRCGFGVGDTGATCRMFVGLAANGFLQGTNAEPSTFTEIIGVGGQSGATTLSWYENDATGTATMTALGTGSLGGTAPINTADAEPYELTIYSTPSGNPTLTLRRISTGDVWTRTPTTDLPATSTNLCFQLWRNTGATASIANIDFMGLVEEYPL